LGWGVVTQSESKVDATNESAKMKSSPAELLFAVVRDEIPRLLSKPMKDKEVAAALDLTNAQTKAWLRRLVDEGVLEKKNRRRVTSLNRDGCLTDRWTRH
jgi:DNA processing protein